MSQRFHLHLLSDSTGETLENIAKAALAQFDGAENVVKHFWPMVRSESHLDRILLDVATNPGLVLFTLVNRDTRRKRKEIHASGDTAQLSQVMRENLFLQMISTYDRIDAQAIRIHRDACVATRFKSKPIARPGGLAEQLEKYTGPVLLIWGEHDITCTPEYLIEILVTGRPNRSKELVVDSGHWVQYEKSDQINATLIQWFESA